MNDKSSPKEGPRKRFLPFDYARCADRECPKAKVCSRYLSPWAPIQSVIETCRTEEGETPSFLDIGG